MAQSKESTSGDLDKRCRRKWESIFSNNDLYFDEELDYEYSDNEDISNSFPLRYSWPRSSSAASSPASSRAASPINLIDDDEAEYAKAQAFKKLTREFNSLVAVKHGSSLPYLRKNWRKNTDFKGILKRWRIRSLDVIFSFKTASRSTHNLRLPPLRRIVRPMHDRGSRNTAVDAVDNISIVVNNDLCTPAVPDLGYSVIMPPGLDMPLLDIPSSSQMIDRSERTHFFEKDIFETYDDPVCDTIFRTVLQQASQQQDIPIRPIRPGSAISFRQILRHEPYNRPASVGGQCIVSNFGCSIPSSSGASYNTIF